MLDASAAAPLLSAGIRLFDVPGTHDENAARAAVMQSVIASAHVVLVTSKIRRACNDKSAKDLMPLGLRRLLLEQRKREGVGSTP